MDGFNLHDELSTEVWRATSVEGTNVLLKFPEDCTSLSAFSACRREYEMGARLSDIEGVLAPKQILEGDGMVGLLFDDPVGGNLLANYIPTFRATYSSCTSDGLREFLRLSINLAKLVEEIHGKGIVLCYIQPENILVTPQEVFLFDFSHATNFPANPSVLELADCDLRYMSPEATGRTQHNVDVRSDLYSLGATLFHLITGRVPFQFDTAAALVYAHIAKKPPLVADLVPGIPTVISQIIARLLNKSPLERYQTAYGLKWDLEQCQLLLRDNNISSFPLGTHDQMHKFSLPATIFGRENELALLNTTFEKVASGSSVLVFVSGVSGIGKTSLIQTAQQQLEQPTAFFISGKFDQLNKFSPYSAFLQAAADLMQQVLAMDKWVIEMYKQKLKDVLGSSAQVLIEVIPLLELIIGHHDPAPDLPPIESRNRFNNMFQDFFHVFAGEGSPLFLFVDDLQWADSSTLQMVKLLSSRALPYTALICAYRSNEVSPTSGAGKMIEECRSEIPLSLHIELGPLNIQSLDCLVRYAFPGTNTMPLSQLVLKKTEGNPFFVLQFLRTIHNEGMMHFDPTAESWYWDLQEIHTICSTNNVVEFMVQTLSKFDQATQNVLSFAGCLGNYFNLEILAIAADQTAQKALASLDKALREEYVIKLDDNHFKFVHDRVQQAAFSLIPEKRRPEKQLLIAQRLLKGLSKSSIDQHLFNIVSLLNFGSSLVSDDKDKEQISRLNYSAGIKAKNSTAYGPALIYLRTAASFLGDDPWTENYEFTFSLNEALCECEFLSGSPETAEEIAQQAILHATSRKDKCMIYRIMVQQFVIAAQYEKGVEAGFTCLELYGIHNSRNPSDAEIKEVYTEVKKKLLALPSINYLVEAPAATGTVQECFKLVEAIIPACFFFSINILSAFLSRFLICMIEEGKTPHNAMVIVWFAGFVAGTRYHDFQLGFELGQVALKLNEQYNEPSSTMIGNFVFGDFINYWKQPLSTDALYLQKAFKGAIECGDLGYACYAVCHLYTVTFMIGTPIKEFFSFMEPYANFVNSTKYSEMQDMVLSMNIAVSSLREGGLKTLEGAEFLALEDRILNTRSLCAQSYHFIFKMMMQCFLGDFDGALVSAQYSEKALTGTYAHSFQICHYFFYTVALTASHNYKGEGSEEALKQIEWNHREIEVYADVSPENFQVMHQISQACIKKLQGDMYSVYELLESSIENATTGGLIPIKALANERLANALAIRGKTKAAELYIIESLSAWEQYGAFVKIDEIQQKYPAVRWKKVKYKPQQQNSLGTMDLHSILAASHSLSEQIMLPQLLTQLMTITMETAGAERGYLLLPKEDDPDVFWTAAESIGDQNIHVHISDGESPAQVSETILNYVKRTRTVVVLADASTDKRWKSDPYISSHRTKSVLCMPFARQGNLEAILYLENNLVAGAFSSEFLNVLNMLAAQAAISIQNSRMYMHLLRAKEQVQRAIEAQRHLSESLPLIVYSLRADGEIEYINQRWCTYTGLSLDESLGHHLYSCNLHPEDAVRVAEAVAAGAHEGKDLDIECRIQRADGVYLWHLLRAEAKRDMNGGGVFMGWNGTFMDIDDRKKIEEINKADKAKSRFLASMSHEMRTPLSGVIGMASLLCTTSLSSEQTDMVHTISMCSELLLVLINNILDIFKLEENKVVLEKLEISPLECAEKSMDIITVGANDKKIDVILDFDDDVPPFVIGDSHRLEQIFINLLGNAVKFTPEGGEIIVQGMRDPTFPDDGDDKSMHLQFTVQDTGVGVPPEGEAKLFQLFSQCDTSTTRVFGGTGLGLAISKRLVEMMGGQIWYENRGKGATFVFTIVVPRANTTAINGLSPPKVESVYLAGRPSTLHNVIARKLKCTGASITTTAEFDPSLVKSSFCTIAVDGEEVDWSAQSLPPGAHVLALSRNIQIYDKLPKGLTFLRKPVKFRRLIQYLSKIRIPEKELVSTLKQKNHLEYPLRILLADDNEMNLKVALKLLASIGYSNVKVARNGIEVLQELERGDFDIILMDMEMPLMDGCQATAIIRSKMRDTPIHIISMTANAFPEDWARCANAGMCSYLPKPFKRETLQAELNKAILVQMGKHYCNQCSPKTFSPASPLSPSPPPTLSLLPPSPSPTYHPNLTSSTKTLSNIPA